MKIARSVHGRRRPSRTNSGSTHGDSWQDNEIRGAALQALMSSPEVPADRIDITVANGWLTLKGEVQHQSENDAAFETVCRLPGVGGITNEIKVITAGIDG